MLGKAWVVAYDNLENQGDLVKTILTCRGVGDAEKFLNPSIKEYMPDPSVLTDVDVAARVVADAVHNKDKIAIFFMLSPKIIISL